MAKELPYFQFEPAAYLTGNIQYCSHAAQGLFVNIACFYWQRECEMLERELMRKYSGNEILIQELIDEGVIKITGGKMIIEFLIDQYEAISYKKNVLSESGRKGAKIAAENRQKNKKQLSMSLEETAGTKPAIDGSFFYIGTSLFKQPVSDYVREHMEIMLNSFMIQMQPLKDDQVLKQMDIEYMGYQFNDVNHIQNSFKSVARIMKGKLTKSTGVDTEIKSTIRNRPNTDA